MTRIAFFGHDAGDAAVRRRVVAFEAAGYPVTGFTMRRGDDDLREWDNIDLGQTFDAAYWQRLRAIFRGIMIASQHRERLSQTDLIYARNLDMLICAMSARRRLKLDIPVVYECLDVHHLLTRRDPLGLVLRKVEQRLLRETCLLVYSSPAFEREFFSRHYEGLYTPYLLENRLVDGKTLPVRPEVAAVAQMPLRIGWFGVLRCHRSLGLLESMARQFKAEIEVIIRGIPAKTQLHEFQGRIDQQANMFFGGSYQAPQDLPTLYADVDVVWAGDFYQAGFNSKWLLPNRIYEGGYFSVPPIAPADSETGQWIEDRNVGFTVAEPLEDNLANLVRTLLANRARIREKAEILNRLPASTFVQPIDQMRDLVERALGARRKDAA